MKITLKIMLHSVEAECRLKAWEHIRHGLGNSEETIRSVPSAITWVSFLFKQKMYIVHKDE